MTWFIPRARPDIKWSHEKASEDLFLHLVQTNGIDIPPEDIRYIQDLIRGEPRDGWCEEGDRRKFLYQIVANKDTSVDVDKAVELMIVDALLAADPYLKISSTIDDMARYTYLSDSILNEIERSTAPELEEARSILQRLRKRELYQLADSYIVPKEYQKYATREYFNFARISEFQEEAKGTIMRENPTLGAKLQNQFIENEDVYVDILAISYCFKDNNPVDNIKFVTKWRIEKPFVDTPFSDVLCS
ncbi:SAM domain and HD [Phlyctochytrium bullatum]|nr:SAM domain and HD [Phlyctochytrium bullatum]